MIKLNVIYCSVEGQFKSKYTYVIDIQLYNNTVLIFYIFKSTK